MVVAVSSAKQQSIQSIEARITHEWFHHQLDWSSIIHGRGFADPPLWGRAKVDFACLKNRSLKGGVCLYFTSNRVRKCSLVGKWL
jgi:hypothetical protein